MKAAKIAAEIGGIWQVGGDFSYVRGAWAGVICIHPPPYIPAHILCHSETSSERRTASEEKDGDKGRTRTRVLNLWLAHYVLAFR